MGTLVIEEWSGTGTVEDRGSQVFSGLQAVTEDATTSATDETVTLAKGTRVVHIEAVDGAHRVTIGASTVGSVFMYIPSGSARDVAVRGGETLAYEAV